MSYTRALGVGPVYSTTVIPAVIPRPYATMTVCDVQRHLIAAGKAITPDGAWGPKSKSAFSDWARAQPASVKGSVMTGGGWLPTFGTREDYKLDGTKIRIPAPYAMALPAPAAVSCRSAARTSTPGTSPAPATTEPDGGTTWSPGTGESASFADYLGAYGPWVALAAVAAGGGYWYWKRKHPKAK